MAFTMLVDSFDFESPSSSSSINLENCLNGLHLQDLLKLKHSIEYLPKEATVNDFNANNDKKICKIYNNDNDNDHADDADDAVGADDECKRRETLPLMAENREYISSSGYDYGSHTDAEEKPSRLQAIFHISITALAFLAFGGYLLCLIVQAIKNKGQLMYIKPMQSTTVAPMANSGVKGIKIYKRTRRSTTTSTTTTTAVPSFISLGSYDPYNPYRYYMKNNVRDNL